MSFARSDVRKDNSFRNAKAPLLQKIFHLLSTTAIFCLLSVARVCLASIAREPFWRPRAGLTPVCRPRAYLPLASPSLLGVGGLGGHLRGLAPRFWAREPVASLREAPLGPSLRARTPFWAREPVASWREASWGHLRGLAPRFGAREPVVPWPGAPLGPSPRARTPFWAREPVAPWREAPRWPFLRARTPFWGPRARRSLAWGPSGAISAGSQICGYEVCRAEGGGARGAEPASGWRRDVFSSLGGP